MKTVTIRDAKARLNELITLSEKGEDVVIMRGSKPVACIKPVSENDLTLEPVLTDAQAERFWKGIHEEMEAGKGKYYSSFPEAVSELKHSYKVRRRR